MPSPCQWVMRLAELEPEPVIDLDDEAIVGRYAPERVQVAAEVEVADPDLGVLLSLPDHEDGRARPVFPTEHRVAQQGADVEVAVRELVFDHAVAVEVDQLGVVHAADSAPGRG